MSVWQLFIRHAHRDVSERSLDNGLSKKGRAQSEALVDYLESHKPKRIPKRILTSPKARCRETAAYVSRWAQVPVEIDERLDEQHESDAQFIERIENFYHSMKDRSELCFVSHGDVLPILAKLAGHSADKIKKGEVFWLVDGRLKGLNAVNFSGN